MKETLGAVFYLSVLTVISVGVVRALLNMFKALRSGDYQSIVNQSLVLLLCMAVILLVFGAELRSGAIASGKLFK